MIMRYAFFADQRNSDDVLNCGGFEKIHCQFAMEKVINEKAIGILFCRLPGGLGK